MKFSVLRECCTRETVERPLLVMICGPSGAGKTRLLSALADLLRVRMGSAILHCSAHELVENLVENIKRGSCKSFRDGLMMYRALLIDNIWVLACRPHAAEEIFSCFRMCLRQGSLIFITSDLAPATISTWSEEIGDIMKESRIFPIFKRHCRGGFRKNREAAALGVPVYSVFRGKIGAVDRYLSDNGRLTLLETVEDVQTKILLNKRHQSDKPDNSKRNALGKIVELIEKILKEEK